MADLLSLVKRAAATEDSAEAAAAVADLKAAVAQSRSAGSSGAQLPDGGLTASLHCAVEAAHAGLVQLLLEARADAADQGAKGVSPLHLAAFGGDPAVLRLLIDSRADPDVSDRHGQTPLFFAPGAEVCALLVEARANPNQLNKKGQTALHLAANGGMDEVVRWLCGRMSPGLISAQDKHGRTALWCARKQGLAGTAAVLEAHGASVRLQPKGHQEKRFNNRKLPSSTSTPWEADFKDIFDFELQLRQIEAEVASAPPDLPGQVPSFPVLPQEALRSSANEEGSSLCEYETISPKRPRTELAHLSDEPRHLDRDVLQVLAETLGADGKDLFDDLELPVAMASARECEEVPTEPQVLSDDPAPEAPGLEVVMRAEVLAHDNYDAPAEPRVAEALEQPALQSAPSPAAAQAPQQVAQAVVAPQERPQTPETPQVRRLMDLEDEVSQVLEAPPRAAQLPQCGETLEGHASSVDHHRDPGGMGPEAHAAAADLEDALRLIEELPARPTAPQQEGEEELSSGAAEAQAAGEDDALGLEGGVAVRLTIQSMDFEALCANPPLLAAVKAVLRQCLADAAASDAGEPRRRVALELSAGSVRVLAAVHPLSEDDGAAVAAKLSASTAAGAISAQVCEGVGAIEGIQAVCGGPVSVGDVSVVPQLSPEGGTDSVQPVAADILGSPVLAPEEESLQEARPPEPARTTTAPIDTFASPREEEVAAHIKDALGSARIMPQPTPAGPVLIEEMFLSPKAEEPALALERDLLHQQSPTGPDFIEEFPGSPAAPSGQLNPEPEALAHPVVAEQPSQEEEEEAVAHVPPAASEEPLQQEAPPEDAAVGEVPAPTASEQPGLVEAVEAPADSNAASQPAAAEAPQDGEAAGEQVQAAPEAKPATVHGYAAGESAFVWSNSQSQWLPCRILAVFQEDTVADGYDILANTVKVQSSAGLKYVAEGQIPSVLAKDAQAASGGGGATATAAQSDGAGSPAGPPAVVHGYSAGDWVEIWSTSRGDWLPGRVEAVFPERTFSDGYQIEANTIRAQICVEHSGTGLKYINEDHIPVLLRAPAPAEPAQSSTAKAPAVYGFSAGDAVQVFSATRGTWLPGVVAAVFPDETVADGYDIQANTIKVESMAGVKYVVEEDIAQVLKKEPDAGAFYPSVAQMVAEAETTGAGASGQIVVTKNSVDEMLGIQHCAIDDGMLILQVSSGGAVSRANRSQAAAAAASNGAPGLELQVGDVVVQVNEIRGDYKAMRAEMQTKQELQMRVGSRRQILQMQVTKRSPDEKLGLEHRNVEGHALVLSIAPGLAVDRANQESAARSPAGPQLSVTDFIFQVNNVKRDYFKMREEMQRQQELTIFALRSKAGMPAEPPERTVSPPPPPSTAPARPGQRAGEPFELVVPKESVEEPLGLVVATSLKDGHTFVDGIRAGGAVERANRVGARSRPPAPQLKAGDALVKVNGVAGSRAALVEELRARSSEVVLHCVRGKAGAAVAATPGLGDAPLAVDSPPSLPPPPRTADLTKPGRRRGPGAAAEAAAAEAAASASDGEQGARATAAARAQAAAEVAALDPEQQARDAAATKIQATHRGRSTYRRFRAEVGKLLPKEVSQDGCIYWDVTLTKSDPTERYGFSHTSDVEEFARARGALKLPASAPEGPQCLMVKQVLDNGLLGRWNEEHPEVEVTRTDRIVEVNGVTGVKEMQRQLQEPSVRMRVCRYPTHFKVQLRRAEGKMYGIKFYQEEAEVRGAKMKTLRITDIHPKGVMEQHNLLHVSQRQFQYVVTQGMSIESVNGTTGNSADLLELFRSSTSALIQVCRGEAVNLARGRARLKMRILAALQ